MMNVFRAVFAKEMIDSLRDRRSIMGALVMPIIGPLMFAMMFSLLAKKHDSEKPLELAISGGEHAPALVLFLEQHEVILNDAPDDFEEQVREGDLGVVLVIDEEFGTAFSAGRPAPLRLFLDESNEDTSTPIRRIRGKLREYSQSIGALRLLARGVTPSLIAPLKLEEIDLSTPQKLGARLLGMIPMFAFLAAFMGGMNVAIDATAGERERGSLEPLLINPAPRLGIVLGKWLATSLFNLAVALLTLLSFTIAIRFVPFETLVGPVEYGLPQIVAIFLLVIPVALFSAALLMTVSLFAHSFKEAQTYLSVLIFIPMLPGMVLMVGSLKTKAWMMLIPTFGHNILVTDVIRGEPLNALHIAIASAACLAAAGALLALAARLFQHEKIVFGR